jgi:hypothetical protein
MDLHLTVMQIAEALFRNRRHVQFVGRRRSTLRRFLSAFISPTNIEEAPIGLVTPRRV